MYTSEELRADPEVKELFANFHGASAQAEKAIELLVGENDGLDAMRKILPALREKKLFVFFSYKKKDEPTAEAIVEILREHSAGKLEIAYMAEFTEEIAGRNWRENIRSEVSRANWFILLLPDTSEDWDWCLYETGLFDRQPTSADRLICIHHPKIKLPSEIEEYHAVPANIDEVAKFLRMVFVNDNPIPGMNPINGHIEKKIPQISQQIVDVINPPK